MNSEDKINLKKKWKSEWIYLLLSLLLAFCIWCIHDLSLEYSVYVQYKVAVKTNIEGYAADSKAEEQLIVRGKGQGFYILKHRSRNGNVSELNLSVDGKYFHPVEEKKNMFYLDIKDVREKINNAIGDKFSVDFIETSRLTFHFLSQTYKKVPLVPQTEISFKSQYMQVGEINLIPDSVTVYGNEIDLNEISSVSTRKIAYSSLDKKSQGVTQPDQIRNVRIAEDKIRYSIDVERYVENCNDISLKAVNVPQGKTLIILPSTVNITYRTPFSRDIEELVENPVFVVDYNDFIKSKSSMVIPRFEKYGRSIYSYVLDPPVVECFLIESR